MATAPKRRRPSTAIAARPASDEAARRLEDEVRRQTSWLLRAQDDERRRIARELHDSTAQQLAALLTNLDLIGANATLTPRGRRLLADSIGLLEDCAKEIRTISYLLHPPFLDEFGLGTTLRNFVDGFGQRSGIRVTFSMARNISRLLPASELGIFRVVQESLSNIHRHSGSKVASIRLARDGDILVLEVRDRGRGIGDRSLSSPGGLGIPGMRERIRLLGGEFTIDSTRSGTTVRATLPAPLADLARRRR